VASISLMVFASASLKFSFSSSKNAFAFAGSLKNFLSAKKTK